MSEKQALQLERSLLPLTCMSSASPANEHREVVQFDRTRRRSADPDRETSADPECSECVAVRS